MESSFFAKSFCGDKEFWTAFEVREGENYARIL